MRFKFLLITFIILLTFSAPKSFCGGTEFSSFFGAKTVSLNGLYFGGIDGVVTAYNNPAGLIYLDDNSFQFSIIDQLGKHQFISAGEDVHQSYRSDDFSVGGGINWNFSNDFSTALVYAPAVDYRVNWPFLEIYDNDSLNQVLAFNMFNRVQINSITPAAAMRFGSWSVGLAANIYLVNFNTAFPISNPAWFDGEGDAAYQFEYNLDAVAYGFTVGASGQISDDITFGAVVRSGYSASVEGDASSDMFLELDSSAQTVNTSADIEMPWTFGAGIVYNLNPELKINIDAEYKLWGSNNSIDFDFGNAVWQSGLASTDSATGVNGSSFNFANENSLRAGIGIEYIAYEDLSVRCGYRYTQTQNSEQNYNFLFPGVSSHTLSFGFGLTEDNIVLDAAVMYSIGAEQKIVTGLPGSTGKYKSDNIVPVVSVKYKF